MGQDKDSLIEEKKIVIKKQSLTTSHKQTDVSKQQLFYTDSLQLLLLGTMLYGMEYWLGQFGLAAPAVSPPSLLPQTTHCRGRVGKTESLDAVQALFKNR